MTFLEEYVASVASLPLELKTNYNLLGELDLRHQDLQKQMLECHGHGLEDVRKVVNSGCAMPDDLVQKYSSEILAMHDECLALSNDKVALAVQTYDLVDTHIQSLDKYLQKFKEEAGQGSCKELEGEMPFGDGKGETGRVSKIGEISKSSRKRGQAAATALSASVDLDLPVDPNEPTYCYCKQVSFGEMIACDNAECKIEWFHYDCVGIKEQPKGKWYCPDCSSLMRHRRGK